MKTPIYLEIGTKKVFASALDWPGWCRSAGDEQAALEALIAAAPRYARVTELAGVAFLRPGSLADFEIHERLPGGSTTNFGAPETIPSVDEQPYTQEELQKTVSILRACWGVFDQARQNAHGKELRKGPRGGGRELEGIARHVSESEIGYLSMVGHKLKLDTNVNEIEREKMVRQEVLTGLENANQADYPSIGPRGGKRWPVRYFVRRVAWHILDHAWEIDDRL